MIKELIKKILDALKKKKVSQETFLSVFAPLRAIHTHTLTQSQTTLCFASLREHTYTQTHNHKQLKTFASLRETNTTLKHKLLQS